MFSPQKELEKLASRKLRINAKETMKIAEKLYTQGCISYPRTETNMFPAGFDLTSLVQHQTQDPQWGGDYCRFFSLAHSLLTFAWSRIN